MKLFRLAILLSYVVVVTACQSTSPSEAQALTPIVNEVPTDTIYRQLRSDQPQDRIEALQLLAKQPDDAKKSISLILALLGDDRQVDITHYVGSGFYKGQTSSPAEKAAELLAKLGRWSVLPLRLRLHDNNPVVRRYAVRALGIIADPEYAAWLLQALADTNANVSKEAYAALLKQDPQVYVKLIDKLDISQWSVSRQILLIQLLGNSQHGDALPALSRFVDDTNPVIRSASFAALAKFTEANIQNLVLRGMKDSDSRVSQNALLLAPQHNSQVVLAEVFTLLTSDSVEVRQTVLEVLPIMTNEKPRSIEAWQKWWHARSAGQPKLH